MFDNVATWIAIGLVSFFLMLIFLDRITAHKSVVKTSADMLPGKLALVTVMCTESHVGQVLVNGQEWTALSTQGQLHSGLQVRVVRVQGIRLIVEELLPAV